jgi:hypothetical protein
MIVISYINMLVDHFADYDIFNGLTKPLYIENICICYTIMVINGLATNFQG